MKKKHLTSILRTLVALFVASHVVEAQDGAASRWSCSFEQVEGYFPERSPRGGVVSSIGGTVDVVSGGAFEGVQHLRFRSKQPEDALVIRMAEHVASGEERSISFAVRISERDDPSARLVLTYGQSIELHPSGTLYVGPQLSRTRPVVTIAKGWTHMEIVEHRDSSSWSLVVGGHVVASGLLLQEAPATLRDLMIFSNGSLDLDALSVVARAPGEARSPISEGATSSELPAPEAVALENADPKNKGESDHDVVYTAAFAEAISGRTSDAAKTISKLYKETAENGRSKLALGQLIATLAFALRDNGYAMAASSMAEEALRVLKSATNSSFHESDSWGRATVEYLTGQLLEEVVFDPKEAEKAYRRAAGLDQRFAAALYKAERLSKSKVNERAAQAHAGKDGAL